MGAQANVPDDSSLKADAAADLIPMLAGKLVDYPVHRGDWCGRLTHSQA